MESESVLGSLLHLALFVAAVSFVGVVAVALLERLSGTVRTIRRVHLAAPAAILVALIVAERVYHLMT